jgi:SsrA-binding protein
MARSPSPKKPSATDDGDVERVVAVNRRAKFEYDVLDELECGLQLVGSEVKSLRNGKVSLEDAYARVKNGEVWLHGCEIPEYVQANQLNHEPKRARKLLLHKREVEKFAGKATVQRLTLVPLSLYFKRGLAKVLLALCKGRQLHDKREKLKERTMQRDIERAMRKNGPRPRRGGGGRGRERE